MSARPITDVLRHIAGGMLLDHASDQFAELVRAIDTNGGTGKITLELNVKKASRGGAMLVTGKSTLKKPADEPMEAMLFATPEGNLVADDPRQQKLDLKRVDTADTPPSELKTA
ncbi:MULTISPECIES: hypothetical protein [unclassified Paraburkholderia]|uniref:hypothetical protein n=1 Tax=unclassified Paraburkholderia TaxID=2615204 RepID=UPI00161EF1CA|nr:MULTISPECIES: hypothetical protein [unclassified Paraburkholderia]MBB5443257.1 hypothetical protein [Paraburkholderia sp. WSM4177]MBB5483137.1 hypothetical protein [Paraburkholderia sp. WSM4180]